MYPLLRLSAFSKFLDAHQTQDGEKQFVSIASTHPSQEKKEKNFDKA